MPQKPRFRAVAAIDPEKLAEFQAGNPQALFGRADPRRAAGVRRAARPVADDARVRGRPETTVHPQTVIEHFGSWNAAKRAAGLVPRRFATRDELLGLLRELGEELGRPPTARDIDEHKGRLPSKSLYWHTFGSLDERAARGGVRRAGGGGAARAGGRAGDARSRGRSGGCRSSPTGPRRARRTTRS